MLGKGASNGKGIDKVGVSPPGVLPPIGRPTGTLTRPGGTLGSPAIALPPLGGHMSGLPPVGSQGPLARTGELSTVCVNVITIFVVV